MGKKWYDADYDLGDHQHQNQADQQEQEDQKNTTPYGDRGNTGSPNNLGDRPEQPQNDPRNRGDNKPPMDDRNRNDQDRSQKDNKDGPAKQKKDRKNGKNDSQADAAKKHASSAGRGLGAGVGGLGAGDLMNRGVKNLAGDKLNKLSDAKNKLSDAKDNLTNPKMGLKNLAKKHGLPTEMPTADNIKNGIKNKVKDGVKNTLKESVKPLDFERPPQTATARSLKETIEHDREQIQERIKAAKKVAKTMRKATRFAILHHFLVGLLLFAALAAIGGAISVITNSTINSNSDCSPSSTTDSGSTASGDEKANMNTIYKTIMEGVPKATPAGVAGLIGNGMVESSLNPAAIQSGQSYNDAKAKGSSYAYAFGVWQMDGGRRARLIDYATKGGKQWSDLGAQIAYIVDPAGDGSDATLLYHLITTASDPATSAEAIRAQWEVGGVGTTSVRQANAKQVYAQMADKNYSYKSALKSLSTGSAINFGSSGSGSDGSSSGGSDSNIANGNDAANDNSDNSACSGDSDDAETGAATELLGKALTLGKEAAKSHKYVYSMYGKRDGSDNSFDCSGFVTTMLKEAGYSKIPLGSTVSMLAATEGSSPEVGGTNLGSKALYKQVDLNTAKKGTIVIFGGKNGAGGAGHVVFLAEDFHGDDTKVLESTDWGTGEGEYSNKNNGPITIAGESAQYGPAYGGIYRNASSPGKPVAVLPLDSDK